MKKKSKSGGGTNSSVTEKRREAELLKVWTITPDEVLESDKPKKQENANTIVDTFNYVSTRNQYPSMTSRVSENDAKKEFKTLTNVYDLYGGKYSRKEMDIAISKLNEIDKNAVKARFGEDFQHPVSLFEMDSKMRTRFMGKTTTQLYKFLSNPNYVASTDYNTETIEYTTINNSTKNKRKIRDYTSFYTFFSGYEKDLLDDVLANTNEDYRKTIYAIWGESLDKFNEEALTPEVKKYLLYNINSNLIAKMKRIKRQSENPNLKKQKETLSKPAKRKYKKRDYTTYYTYFGKHSKEIMDKIYENTNENYKKTLVAIWGDTLDEFHEEALTPEVKKYLNSLSTNLEKQAKRREKLEETGKVKHNIKKQENEDRAKIEVTEENRQISGEEEITKEGYIALAEMIKTEKFQNLMKKVGKKEAFIVSLKLEENTNEAIANFLEIPTEEVISTTKNILMQYKEQVLIEMEEKMDQAIDVITNNKIKMKKDTNNE